MQLILSSHHRPVPPGDILPGLPTTYNALRSYLSTFGRSTHPISDQVKEVTMRSWLRHCVTSREVAGSIPDGVILPTALQPGILAGV